MDRMERTPSCRFCYSYKPPGIIEPTCIPPICVNQTIASISTNPAVINNNTRTTEQSLLLAVQQQYLEGIQQSNTNNTVQYTAQNIDAITASLQSQLAQVAIQRYKPYQPYNYPCLPPSVIELQMKTANVGVPIPVATIASCKGSQFVTT
jgi:hypothetical protein